MSVILEIVKSDWELPYYTPETHGKKLQLLKMLKEEGIGPSLLAAISADIEVLRQSAYVTGHCEMGEKWLEGKSGS